MEMFVKNRLTFKAVRRATSLGHDLVLDSLDKEASSASVPADAISRSDIGNWLIADGNVYLISLVKPGDVKTTLSLQHPLEAFTRPLIFEDPTEGQSIGGFIADILRKSWAECTDPEYAFPYLSVSNSDTTAFVPPEVDSNGLFDLAAYCRLMRRTYHIDVKFRASASQLVCTIVASAPAARQVIFTDGRSQLKSVDYGSSGTAKITAIQDGVPSDWYLSEDGQISQNIPDLRAEGSWTTISVSSSADVAVKVAETFAKGRSGHKVEFMSELDLNVLDNCVLRIRGESLNSYISCKRKSSGDNRYYYKAGELATTASEKLRGVKK